MAAGGLKKTNNESPVQGFEGLYFRPAPTSPRTKISRKVFLNLLREHQKSWQRKCNPVKNLFFGGGGKLNKIPKKKLAAETSVKNRWQKRFSPINRSEIVSETAGLKIWREAANEP